MYVKNVLLTISLLFAIICNGQDRDALIKSKSRHLFQSENYYLLNLDNQPLDSAFYLIGGVYSEKKYALNDNKRIKLMYPNSKVVFNKNNNRYYIIISESNDADEIIKTLKALRSMYEPLAWILVYF